MNLVYSKRGFIRESVRAGYIFFFFIYFCRVSRNFDLLTRKFDLVSRNFDLLTQKFDRPMSNFRVNKSKFRDTKLKFRDTMSNFRANKSKFRVNKSKFRDTLQNKKKLYLDLILFRSFNLGPSHPFICINMYLFYFRTC